MNTNRCVESAKKNLQATLFCLFFPHKRKMDRFNQGPHYPNYGVKSKATESTRKNLVLAWLSTKTRMSSCSTWWWQSCPQPLSSWLAYHHHPLHHCHLSPRYHQNIKYHFVYSFSHRGLFFLSCLLLSIGSISISCFWFFLWFLRFRIKVESEEVIGFFSGREARRNLRGNRISDFKSCNEPFIVHCQLAWC